MKERNWLLIAVATAVVLGLGAVVAVLTVPTEPRALAIGEERPFGGFDPHLAVAVTEIRRLGADEREEIDRDQDEELWAVTVEARNTAVEVAVDPSRLAFSVRDASGERFRPLPAHDRFLEPLEAARMERRTLLFRLPRELAIPVFWITWDDSLLHAFPWLERTMLFPKAVVPLEPAGR
ncbi:MAG TPA: hypothetical protein VMV46_04635 [Thermoanaerobaculia bacterium]|nr:hypothetical protein [Thermoanaerobaculia bacterium]